MYKQTYITRVSLAFSTVISWVKVMERYGLSVLQAAALLLARRLLGSTEGIPGRREAPVGNGVRVAFTVPAGKEVKHMQPLTRCCGLARKGKNCTGRGRNCF